MKDTAIRLWRRNRGFITFIILMALFRSACADWNSVPTGSMKPTIVPGDRILVNKMAYDLRIPFTHISLWQLDDPQRGDIVVFDSEVADKRLVKRVIGLPGDWVEMSDDRLVINGRPARYAKASATDFTEQLPGAHHMIRIEPQDERLSSFPPVRVPSNHYLVLGDNRDNSADSRVIGFVPRAEIVGRTRTVVMSLNYDNFYIPRRERFLKTL